MYNRTLSKRMKKKISFLAITLFFLSCGNAQKIKTSDHITGIFSYSKAGLPIFRIKDTIIQGKKGYTIYDYKNKIVLKGINYYDNNNKNKIPKWKKKTLDECIGWEEWLYNEIKATRFKGNKKEEITFDRVRKGLVLENTFSEEVKRKIELMKLLKVNLTGYDQKITTGFFVTIVKKGTSDSELKILYKIKDI